MMSENHHKVGTLISGLGKKKHISRYNLKKIPKEFSFRLRGLFENDLARIPLNSGSILNAWALCHIFSNLTRWSNVQFFI